jgi:ABC-2 type transport system ATP-binding protein
MTGRLPILEVRDLSKSYRRRSVLRELSMGVGAGEAVAIIGPNGAGKSTFLGCVTGERVPDAGTVRICGHDPFSDPRGVAECMGFVPEQPFLYGELTVGEILRFVAEVRRIDREVAAEETARLLARFGLEGAENAFCRELSQGMARKAAVIAALLHRPRLLVLDEAFNGLDLPSAERLVLELDERRRGGASVLLSSHDLELLAGWCDRGLLLAPSGWSVLDGEEWEDWKRAPALPRQRDGAPDRGYPE